jgi:hypothetical protein
MAMLDFAFQSHSVKLEVLDENDGVRSYDSGFILTEGSRHYLYTCWHAVTGFDPRDPKVKEPPAYKKLRVLSLKVWRGKVGIDSGGIHETVIPLYGDGRPRWIQEVDEKPHPDLNAIGIRVPLTFDVVKIPIELSAAQKEEIAIPENWVYRVHPETAATMERRIRETIGWLPDRGEHLPAPPVFTPTLVVGFPHGFSVTSSSIDPVFLTRFVAHSGLAGGNVGTFYLDNPASRGMSGGPVWVAQDPRGPTGALAGIYVGSVFPDYRPDRRNNYENDKFAALGIVANLAWVRRAFGKPFRPQEAQQTTS